MADKDHIQPPAEHRFARELAALAANDPGAKPVNWNLSPQTVRQFIIGSDGAALSHEWEGKKTKTVITKKYYGDTALIERCIVTVLGQRGLMLVGEPGTAKSMLSELLSAAISGDSTLVIQGTAGTTDDHIKYSWNYALLLAEGPSQRALVPSPLHTAMKRGGLVRFEEITRCQPEIQDTMVSVLSDKAMHIPELGEDAVLQAQRGFNVIATANLRDRGVHEMSSALKRRFNFETVPALDDKKLEMELVRLQAETLLSGSGIQVKYPEDVMEVLVTTFQDLRQGRTDEGTVIEKPSTVMSTAEAVAVAHAAALDAHYFGKGSVEPEHLARQLLGTALKDNPDDAKKLRHYLDVVVKARAAKGRAWSQFHSARRWLTR
ncbi:MoxR-like ATPase [Roseimicrobium gellanilyticum]|uniref:MoxR-like ATPase n=1 Tax=Roseimicrobium gellanilyticum TaxID=748857 RepID=A0A366HPR6_9BACT|nr:AAA family ATPase [Roseimicrobium gellanilyticum]RBP44595.1 MoxR-like ATPase [Roseimicrobium gellanilyticum]